MNSFGQMDNDELIDYVRKGVGSGGQTAAILEMQRRNTEAQRHLIDAIKAFDKDMGTSWERQATQTTTLIALTEETSFLTKWIIALTVLLGIIAVAQLVAMFMGKG